MWWNASRGHNVLQFGNHEQPPGAEFLAKLIGLEDCGATIQLELELAGAYSPGAGIKSWRRSYFLRRGDSPTVTITDSFHLLRPMAVAFPLFTPCGVDLDDGKAFFKTSAGSGVAMTWDPKALQIADVPLESDEPFWEGVWGTKLRRLVCRIPGEVERAECQITFAPCRLPQPKTPKRI